MTDDVILQFLGWTDPDERPSREWLDWAKGEFTLSLTDDDDANRREVLSLLCRAWRVWTSGQLGRRPWQWEDEASRTCADAIGLADTSFALSDMTIFGSTTIAEVLPVAIDSNILAKRTEGIDQGHLYLTPTGCGIAESTGAPMPPLIDLPAEQAPTRRSELAPAGSVDYGDRHTKDEYFLDAYLVTPTGIGGRLSYCAGLGVFNGEEAHAFEAWLAGELQRCRETFRVPEWLQGKHLWAEVSADYVQSHSDNVYDPDPESMDVAYLCAQSNLDSAPQGTVNLDDDQFWVYALKLTSSEESRANAAIHIERFALLDKEQRWPFATIAKQHANAVRRAFSPALEGKLAEDRGIEDMGKELPTTQKPSMAGSSDLTQLDDPLMVRNLVAYILRMVNHLSWPDVGKELKNRGFQAIGEGAAKQAAKNAVDQFNLAPVPKGQPGRPPKKRSRD